MRTFDGHAQAGNYFREGYKNVLPEATEVSWPDWLDPIGLPVLFGYRIGAAFAERDKNTMEQLRRLANVG